jgi:hypothetical protein
VPLTDAEKRIIDQALTGWTMQTTIRGKTYRQTTQPAFTSCMDSDELDRQRPGKTRRSMKGSIALLDQTYTFTGFFQHVDNTPVVNAAKAGAAVPVKFSLGGDLGLNIFASGYPVSRLVQCSTGQSIDTIEEIVVAGASNLSYDAAAGRYSYVWKTDKAWAGSCRELQVKFTDGQIQTARFTFAKYLFMRAERDG